MLEVMEFVAVSGTYDLLVTVSAETIEQLNAAVDRIGLLDGVERTVSQIIMARRFRRP
jgi:DNA-binding Lrp family transcriptional regulator